MKLVTAAQMRALDREAIEQFGIPGLLLMENAGRGAADEIQDRFGDACEGGVVVLCGPGNNGGDGFVIARHLFNVGFDVACLLVGGRAKLKGDARTNFRIADRLGIQVLSVQTDKQVGVAAALLESTGLIVDALFGTGLARAIEGPAAALIEIVNEMETPVVAVDMPSGVGSDDGKPTGPAIVADLTCTFGLPKVGQFIHPGLDFCGEVSVIDISLPPLWITDPELNTSLITQSTVLAQLPPRDADTHKGTYGHALILGGSRGMTGAAVLAAKAAVVSGAGLVTAAVPSSLIDVVETNLLEALKLPLADDGSGRFSDSAIDAALELARTRDVVALGPGLGQTDALENFVAVLVGSADKPLVIDADGLNNLAADLGVLKQAKGPVVITPHPGEMARLAGVTTAEVQADRLGVARRFAVEHHVIVVLKGARTVVAGPDGQVWINQTGNPGMATGGMGDVLTGLIAGFIAQGMTAIQAALCGVYVHGYAGDTAAENVSGERALTAGLVLDTLPMVLRELEQIHLDTIVEDLL
jgi:ADP-dependent NAD(P)H-hydrate dehydratase / NAD(P)H-hydrate epimerase